MFNFTAGHPLNARPLFLDPATGQPVDGSG
jgi:hypothetical protein